MVPRQIASKIVSLSVINSKNEIETIDELQQPVIITFSTEVKSQLIISGQIIH